MVATSNSAHRSRRSRSTTPGVIGRLGQCAFDRPFPFRNSTHQCVGVNPDVSSPSISRTSLSTERDHNVVSLVVLLLNIGRPLAIFRGVISVHVLPLQRMLRRRALTHVNQKIGERTQPSITHRDPSRAVVFVRCVVRVRTTLLHRVPRLVFWRTSPIGRTSVAKVVHVIRNPRLSFSRHHLTISQQQR